MIVTLKLAEGLIYILTGGLCIIISILLILLYVYSGTKFMLWARKRTKIKLPDWLEVTIAMLVPAIILAICYFVGLLVIKI